MATITSTASMRAIPMFPVHYHVWSYRMGRSEQITAMVRSHSGWAKRGSAHAWAQVPSNRAPFGYQVLACRDQLCSIYQGSQPLGFTVHARQRRQAQAQAAATSAA